MKRVEMYVADDGHVFNNMVDCMRYEKDCQLHEVNKTAVRFPFRLPMTAQTDGEMIVFHAKTQSDIDSMKEFLSVNGSYRKEVWDDGNIVAPIDLVAIIPESADWVQLEKYDLVKSEVNAMLDDLMSYAN